VQFLWSFTNTLITYHAGYLKKEILFKEMKYERCAKARMHSADIYGFAARPMQSNSPFVLEICFSRDHLLSAIWWLSSETEDRTVDSHIRNIREKLRQAEFPNDQHRKTVWGVGYKWSTNNE
jgi:hypothetical protein